MSALTQDSDEDYTLNGESVWITVKNLSVHVHKTDEGVVVDIYPLHDEMNDCVASTYAFWSEGEE